MLSTVILIVMNGKLMMFRVSKWNSTQEFKRGEARDMELI